MICTYVGLAFIDVILDHIKGVNVSRDFATLRGLIEKEESAKKTEKRGSC